MDFVKLLETLKLDEGYSAKVYEDTLDYWTVGYGYCLEKRGLGKITAQQFAALQSKADVQKLVDLEVAKSGLSAQRFWLTKLYETVRDNNKHLEGIFGEYKFSENIFFALNLIAYQIGLEGLMKFEKMIAALNSREFGLAAIELIDSKLGQQTFKRTIRTARIIVKG